MIDNINNELLDLLYDIKELAINQVTISFESLVNTIKLCGYDCYTDESIDTEFYGDENYQLLNIVKIEEDYEEIIVCPLNIKFINDNEVVIYGCDYEGEKPKLNYVVNSSGKVLYARSK